MVEGAKVFIRELEDSKLIKELIYYRDRVKSNKEIMDLLSIIHKEEDDNMLIYYRKKIYSYDDYREYMISYNELSMIVGSINKMFRELMDEKVGGCYESY